MTFPRTAAVTKLYDNIARDFGSDTVEGQLAKDETFRKMADGYTFAQVEKMRVTRTHRENRLELGTAYAEAVGSSDYDRDSRVYSMLCIFVRERAELLAIAGEKVLADTIAGNDAR